MDASTEFSMYSLENRQKTFTDWPYDGMDCVCNSASMAQAGFYRVPSENEPDLVRCFVCLKQLDGWEPEDDPWLEHNKHAGKCPFVKLKKKAAEELTIEHILKLEMERQKYRTKEAIEEKIALYKEKAARTREEVIKILDSNS